MTEPFLGDGARLNADGYSGGALQDHGKVAVMKTVLTTMVIVLSWGCAASVKPVPKAPDATVPQASGDMPPNGTQVTGLAAGDRAVTIRAVTLTSGEIITLQ